jgi:hypothetical protein
MSRIGKRLREARAAFLVLWHEHEAPSGSWRPDKRAGRVLRRQPAGHAEAVTTLRDIAGAFGGRTRIASMDLLARLAAASPGRYGDWNLRDLGGFLRQHGVIRHNINIDGDRRDKHWGHSGTAWPAWPAWGLRLPSPPEALCKGADTEVWFPVVQGSGRREGGLRGMPRTQCVPGVGAGSRGGPQLGDEWRLRRGAALRWVRGWYAEHDLTGAPRSVLSPPAISPYE